MKSRRLTLYAALALAFIGLAACTFVRPQDAALIDSAAANARAYSNAIQSDATVPAGVKGWIKSDAGQWTSFSDWANGRQPATKP